MTTQRSMSRGEVSPSFYAGADLAQYQVSLRTLRNAMTMLERGARRRPGTEFTAEVQDSSKLGRLVPFIFNSEQTYVLEFGHLYIRVHRLGAPVTEAPKTITGISSASQAVVTSVAHGFLDGEELQLAAIVGTTELNGETVVVSDKTTDTFKMKWKQSGLYVDSSAFGAYVSGGTASRIYEIASPYEEDELFDLYYAQSADVVTLTHDSHPTMELTREGHADWTLSEVIFEPAVPRPGLKRTGAHTVDSVTLGGPGSAGSETLEYVVTAISKDTGEESFAGLSDVRTITAISQQNPGRITTATPHGLVSGERVLVDDVDGMVEVNDRYYTVEVVSGTVFKLVGVDTTGYTAYTANGKVWLLRWKVASVIFPTSANKVNITIPVDYGLASYCKVYRRTGGTGVFGLIGQANFVGAFNTGPDSDNFFFEDTGLDADNLQNPPLENIPFPGTGFYPAVCAHYQQRRVFGRSNNFPQGFWATVINSLSNLSVHVPTQDNDAIVTSVPGSQANEIRHLVDLRKLIILTAGSVLVANGDSAGAFTPASTNIRTSSYIGASKVRPLVTNAGLLFVQARGNRVWELGFDAIADGYLGGNISIFSKHLFDGHTIVDAAWQETPNATAWFVREDGIVLGLTYLKDEKVQGWHRHDTLGLIESVCVVPEGGEDVLYWLVKRTIDSATHRYIERMSSSLFESLVDACFMDSAALYDGRNGGATTMTLSGSGWTEVDTLTLTASVAATFKASDVGNAVHLRCLDADGLPTVVRCLITAYTSGTVVSVMPHKTVPISIQAVATTDWDKAVQRVTGLRHLAGQAIAVLGDGFVVADPNDALYDQVLVDADGAAEFDRPYGVIRCGLPYLSDLETMDVDTVEARGGGLIGQQKIVNRAWIFVKDTGALLVGSKPPTDDEEDPTEDLEPLQRRENDTEYDLPVELKTGPLDQDFKADWNSHGRLFIRQTAPLPFEILAIVPEGND